jgi:hypothetical protein
MTHLGPPGLRNHIHHAEAAADAARVPRRMTPAP